MARYESIEEWPGSMVYRTLHGRVYCAAPRGLIPEYPYSVAALRPPTREEAGNWGPGVMPRMVVDVTDAFKLDRGLCVRNLVVAPWNSYLVLCLPDHRLIVAYKTNSSTRRLDSAGAAQVAIASGHDVGGWACELIRHFQDERWHFTPPRYEPVPAPAPTIALTQR